jgi:hypothetical protein
VGGQFLNEIVLEISDFRRAQQSNSQMMNHFTIFSVSKRVQRRLYPVDIESNYHVENCTKREFKDERIYSTFYIFWTEVVCSSNMSSGSLVIPLPFKCLKQINFEFGESFLCFTVGDDLEGEDRHLASFQSQVSQDRIFHRPVHEDQ